MFDPSLVETGTAGDSAAPSPARPGMPVDPERMLREVRRGATWVVASALAVGVLGAVVGRFVLPRKFKASATVVRDAVPQGVSDTARSQKSVAEDLKLDHNLAEVRKRLGIEITLPSLGKAIEVEGANESGLSTIVATAPDPDTAMHLADATAAVFLESRRELERARAKERLTVISSDVDAANRALAVAREGYDAFRKKNDIADPTADRQSSVEIAARLRAEAQLAAVDSVGEEAREQTLRKVERRSSAMMVVGERGSNPAVGRLRESESDLATLRGRLAPDHPKVLAAQAAVDSLKVEAARPPSTVETMMGISPDWDATRRGLALAQSQRAASRRKFEELSELALAARVRAEQLASLEGRASELMAAVKIADTRLAELSSERLLAEASARNPPSGFHLAAAAVRPDKEERSLRLPLALASPVLGLMLGVVLVILRALRGLRVVSPSEAAYWTSVPVIGASRWPEGDAAADDLARDLSQLLSVDVGSVLVVPVGEAEAEAAPVIAAATSAALASEGRTTTVHVFQPGGPSLRRAARDAGRVVLLVASARHSAFELRAAAAGLGRAGGVGVVMLSLGPESTSASDRVGDMQAFLAGARA
jgi:uncharacterized protein involved in exopolysaccharide biosynthesis